MRPLIAFGATVVGAAGGEVGQERGFPLLQGPAEPFDLRDRACWEHFEDPFGDLPSLGEVARGVGAAELLGALVGEVDLFVAVINGDRHLESGFLPVGEFLLPAAHDQPDAIERVTGAAAVTVDLLLDAPPDLISGLTGKVGSAGGAVPASRLARFHRPPPEPDVRLSPHPALHAFTPGRRVPLAVLGSTVSGCGLPGSCNG